MFVHDGRSGNDYLSWNPEKEGCELNAYRFQRILLDAGTDKVSDFSYEQVKAVYFDPLVTDGTAYSYMKYYGEQNVSKEEKEQLEKALPCVWMCWTLRRQGKKTVCCL